MGAPYYQFCPVAKAMELLDERWTMLLMREMLLGTEHFNDLRRGLPRMSPTLLSRRLDQLCRAGLVNRTVEPQGIRYVLTSAGRELQPVVEQLSAWGVRWIGELGDADLDPKLLLWDMHRHVVPSAIPRGRIVIALYFPDARPTQRRWWLVIRDGDADICDDDPGYEPTVQIRCPLRALTRYWRGDVEWGALLTSNDVTVSGPAHLRRGWTTWFTRPDYAGVPRPASRAPSGTQQTDDMDELHESGSIVIHRSPDEIYDMVSDVGRMGEWSPVCKACWWDEGDGPRAGAGFTGRNETSERTWETHSVVEVADPGREFAFVVGSGVARWGYTFEPAEGGTLVTESWRFLPGGYDFFARRYGDGAAEQIEQRHRSAIDGIAVTLAAIKATAERG